MEFFDETLSTLSKITHILPYICLSLFLWLFIISIMIFLLYFNLVDIKSIVEGMKSCVMSI